VIVGYQHFLGLASRVQWDEATIDLRADAAAWPALEPETRARLLTLIAGFCVGEAGVAAHLAPFAAVAGDPLAAACFRAQERDERRHEAFFARVAREVAGVAPARLRAHLPAAFLELFEVRLPALARALAAGEGDLGAAVGLYHMVLEGVVFTAGQLALLETLDDRLPGLRRGAELVLRDERWHVGFGARCLQDAGPDDGALDAILAEGERAAALWAPEHADHVVATLRRRLRAIGGVPAAVAP
jgi:ribonucleoside-diphosphate reductase beta chain